MNLKKKMRRGSLAALIALALTNSALAMPTGGEVVRGVGDITLSGGTWDNVANNATITATNDGQINWATFGIANGETLNFNIANDKTLVNQVTGAQVSDILGTMNQTGGGNIVLVNPNGIHVGQNAVLNVSDLTLSALAIDKASATERVLKKTGEGFINVDTGAHFTANELSLIGTKVTVADGVTFDIGATAGTEKGLLQVYATDSASWTFDDDRVLTKNLTHNAGNDVVFNGTVNMLGGVNSLVEIGGATTSATNARFIDNRAGNDHMETTLYAASKFDLDERGTDRNNHRYSATTTKDNKLTVDSIQAGGESLSLGGGVVELKNSTISVDDLAIDGVASSTSRGDGKRIETLGAPDRTVTITNSTLTANEVAVYGGKVTVASDVTFRPLSTPDQRDFEIVAGNVYHDQSVYKMAAGNELQFHGRVVDFGRAEDAPIALIGHQVNLDGARFQNIGYLNAAAANEVTTSASGVLAKTTDNVLSAAGLSVTADNDLNLVGGTVTLNGAQMSTGIGGTVLITAGSYQEANGNAERISTTANQKVTLDGTSAITAQHIAVAGGKVSVGNNVTFTAANHSGGAFEIAAGNQTFGETGTVSTMRGNDVEFHGKILGLATTNHTVDITGSTVNLDGAQIGSVGNSGIVNVMAAGTTRIKDADHVDIAASAGNALSADGLTVNSSKTNMAGGNVALKNSALRSSGVTLIASVGRIKFDGAQKTATATKANVVHLDNTALSGSDVTTVSGKTNLTNGTQVTGNDVTFRIGRNFVNDHVDTTKDNTLSMWNSHVTGTDVMLAGGGAEVYQGSSVIASDELEQGDVTRTDGSTLSLLKDASSSVKHHNTVDAEGFTVKDAADVPAVPDRPTPPAVPETADTELSKQDQENIDTGRAAAQTAIIGAATQEERVEVLTETVAKLNEKVGTSHRQTAGVLVGVVQAIAESGLTDVEKVELQVAVVNAYAPVQEAKAEQSHLATNTVNEAVRTTETVSVAPVYPDDSETEDVVSFA